MSDFQLNQLVSPSSPATEGMPPSPSEPPKQSNRKLFIIIGLFIVGACLCAVACVALLGTGIITAITERDNVEKVIDEFMQAMVSKNIEAAYALFSVRSQRQTELSALEKMVEGNNYVLFDGYQSATIQNINISLAANTNPDMPQGTVARVDGVVIYAGDIQGRLEAVLEQEANQWRLFYINVTVPPDKFSPD